MKISEALIWGCFFGGIVLLISGSVPAAVVSACLVYVTGRTI